MTVSILKNAIWSKTLILVFGAPNKMILEIVYYLPLLTRIALNYFLVSIIINKYDISKIIFSVKLKTIVTFQLTFLRILTS